MSKIISPDKIEDLNEVLNKWMNLLQDYNCSLRDMFMLGISVLTQSYRLVLKDKEEKTFEEHKEEVIKNIDETFQDLKKEIRACKDPDTLGKEKKNETEGMYKIFQATGG